MSVLKSKLLRILICNSVGKSRSWAIMRLVIALWYVLQSGVMLVMVGPYRRRVVSGAWYDAIIKGRTEPLVEADRRLPRVMPSTEQVRTLNEWITYSISLSYYDLSFHFHLVSRPSGPTFDCCYYELSIDEQTIPTIVYLRCLNYQLRGRGNYCSTCDLRPRPQSTFYLVVIHLVQNPLSYLTALEIFKYYGQLNYEPATKSGQGVYCNPSLKRIVSFIDTSVIPRRHC